jgi:serine/threonine protein kinase
MTPLEPGTQLGPYEIVAQLGAGGMGQVYKARHPRLDRTVALKVLPEELASDPERLERFEREARAASALDHPGIVAIHDIAEAKGIRFIAMQYVRGQTLTETLLDKGRPDLKEALSYGIQIADALSQAHKHGIVHRDLKPDNLMVGQDGRVRILDFGLAKKMDRSEATRFRTAAPSDAPSELTRDGRILGTAPYMSPEQALGERTDHRSDIFSFGSVLYEMVTGRRPFDADNVPGLLVSIVHDEPTRPSALVPGLPLQLEQVLERSLKKDPNKRFQSMADVRVELDEVRAAVDSGSFITAEQRPARRPMKPRRWPWVGSRAILLLALPLAVWLTRSRSEPDAPPSLPLPLTSLDGFESYPKISPDGRQVAFVSDGGEGGPTHVWVVAVTGGQPRQLTDADLSDAYPAWSPDGNEIAFMRAAGEESEILAVPMLGGVERRITTAGWSLGLDWSPDGEWLVFADRGAETEYPTLAIYSLSTGERSQLTAPPSTHWDLEPVFSPDGATVAFMRYPLYGGEGGAVYIQPLGEEPLRALNVAGRIEPTRLTEDDWLRAIDWTPDGREIVFATGEPAGMHLKRVPIAGSEPARLAAGSGAEHLSVARNRSTLVYSESFQIHNIWRVSGPTAEVPVEASRFIGSTRDDLAPAYSPDGDRIAFVSGRSGYWEIWIADSDGRNERQLTQLAHAIYPGWSPDSKRITFSSVATEGLSESGVFVVDASGGLPENLTGSAGGDALPSWSRDGAWIYMQSRRGSDAWRIWKMPAGGGEAIRLSDDNGLRPLESEDGLVYYAAPGDPGWEVRSVPAGGGASSRVMSLTPAQFTIWRNYLVYADRTEPDRSVLKSLDLRSDEVREIAELPGEVPSALSWALSVSPDGKWVLYAALDESGADLMRVDNFR